MTFNCLEKTRLDLGSRSYQTVCFYKSCTVGSWPD